MNKRDFGKLLGELHDNLKKDISDLKTDITSAKRLKTNLEKYFATCEALIEKVTNEETGIEAYHQLAIETKAAIDIAKTSADSQLASISSALTSVQSNIEEMETAYTSFTDINEKLTDEETGLEAIKDSVDAIKDDVIAIKSNSDTLYKEIRKFRDNAASYANEIDQLKKSAGETIKLIENDHTKSQKLSEQIAEIFKLGSRGAHSSYFVTRRNQLFWISVFWVCLFAALLVATLVLAIIFIMPLADTLKDPKATVGIEVFLLRFSIITPTLVGAVYALRQYSHERRLYEKYAFKAISTYSVEASVGTLTRSLEKYNHDRKDEKVIDFAIDIFRRIYDEPLETANEKWILRGSNKVLDVTAEINQDVGDIKKNVDKLLDNKPDTE